MSCFLGAFYDDTDCERWTDVGERGEGKPGVKCEEARKRGSSSRTPCPLPACPNSHCSRSSGCRSFKKQLLAMRARAEDKGVDAKAEGEESPSLQQFPCRRNNPAAAVGLLPGRARTAEKARLSARRPPAQRSLRTRLERSAVGALRSHVDAGSSGGSLFCKDVHQPLHRRNRRRRRATPAASELTTLAVKDRSLLARSTLPARFRGHPTSIRDVCVCLWRS